MASVDGSNQIIILNLTTFHLPVRSEDDPFLLYATLHSGNHCWFVSRDLMRDHKACLPDGVTRRLFFKWQRGHQLVVAGYVAAGRRVKFLVSGWLVTTSCKVRAVKSKH